MGPTPDLDVAENEQPLRVMEVNSAERERASAMGECFRFANRKDAPFSVIPGAIRSGHSFCWLVWRATRKRHVADHRTAELVLHPRACYR
jgi:hypothetical protein